MNRSLTSSRRPRSTASSIVVVAVATAFSFVIPTFDAPVRGEEAATETVFTIAQVPDTQNELVSAGNPLMPGRYQWLVDNKDALNLDYIVHTGDVVNWGVADPVQFTRASAATDIIDNSGIPYSYAIGSHDTAAVTVGGGAAPGNVHDNLRNTTAFNQTFPLARFKNVGGTFEPGRVDNMYQTFTAGGLDWMVITHEMWPRQSVIDWMKQIASANPNRNIIVATHAYTDQAGAFPTTGLFGDSSGQIVWDQFISQYPNIRMVLSGHYHPVDGVEGIGYTVATGVNGNRIAQVMTAYHSNYQNHVRLLKIDTANNTISSSVFVANSTSSSYPVGYITDQYSNFVTTNMNWVGGGGPPPLPTAPSAPYGVTASAGVSSATVSFAEPLSAGGSPITGYTVTSSPGNLTVIGASSPISVPGLTSGTAYTFTVTATNAVGTSPPSAASNSVSLQGSGVELLPDPGFETGTGGWTPFIVGTFGRVSSPVRSGATALSIAATSTTNTLVGMTNNNVITNSVAGRRYTGQCFVRPSVTGRNVQIRFLEYTQNYSSNIAIGTTTVSNLPSGTWTLVEVSGLATAAGKRIIPQVYATNQTTSTGTVAYDDCSVVADVPAVTPVTAPSAPTGLVAHAGDRLATLSWAPPASDGGAPVTDYVVQYAVTGSDVWTQFNDGASTTTAATVTGLVNGTSYRFTVAAVNAAGAGAPSGPSDVVTPVALATVPGAPAITGVTAGDASATVSFTPPAQNGGSPITGHVVTSSPGNVTASGAGSPITVTGLTNGTSYTFTVQAVNAVGTSAPSSASSPVTPTATAPPPPQELLADPGFEAGNGGWIPFIVGNLSRVTNPVRTGTRALSIAAVSTTANLVGITHNSVVSSSVAARTYTASCYVRPTSTGRSVTIRLLEYTQNFRSNVKIGTRTIASLPANVWTLIRVSGTAVESARRIVPQVYSSNQTTNTGTIAYDDCSVTSA